MKLLEHLFGSKARYRLLQVLCLSPQKAFDLRELASVMDARLSTVKREVGVLVKLGLLRYCQPEAKSGEAKQLRKAVRGKSVCFDATVPISNELRALLLRSGLVVERSFLDAIQRLRPQLLLLTGIFTGRLGLETDMLIVGRVNRTRLRRIMKDLERTLHREVNYTLMNAQEFAYRHDVTDRFLFDILEGEHIIILDTLTKQRAV